MPTDTRKLQAGECRYRPAHDTALGSADTALQESADTALQESADTALHTFVNEPCTRVLHTSVKGRVRALHTSVNT